MGAALLEVVTIDMYDCAHETLLIPDVIETWMRIAAEKMGAEIIGSSFHQFKPWGVSGTVTIAESHLAIHTWPEYNFAAITFETCGTKMDHDIAIKFLVKIFESKNPVVNRGKRGFMETKENFGSQYQPQKPETRFAFHNT